MHAAPRLREELSMNEVRTQPIDEPRLDYIMQVAFGFWSSKVLLSAVEMELFTELAKGPEDLQTLTGRLGLHPRSARDFLDALVALGFLERTDGKYSNTAATGHFLDKRKPSYAGGLLEMANHRLYGFWNHLTTALRTGEMQSESRGNNFFAELYADPARLKGFMRAMTALSHGANIAIANNFPWSTYKTAVDVGCAQGDLIVQIASVNPHIAGIGFDLPEVAPIFEDYVAENGMASRVRFQPGSFFDDPLPRADVVAMGHVLHDWNLEQKKLLIRKAYDALPPGGAFIAYDSMIDDDRCRSVFGLLISLNMLIETPGGFDYTGADCIGWMKEAGFREANVEFLGGVDSMAVGIK
jgi:SAM-dependent methyltransferase